MGRGRQKAKQAKQARQLKYSSPATDYSALQRELTGGTDDDDLAAHSGFDQGGTEDEDFAEYEVSYLDEEEDDEDAPHNEQRQPSGRS